MTDLKIQYRSAGLLKALAAAPEIVIEEQQRAITEASMLLEREVKERSPTSGAGTLRDSIGAMPITISGALVSGGIGTSLSYAVPVELGSKPHWAPIEPLVDWVERKLHKRGPEARGVARAIQVKIARKGTDGRFMFRDAFDATRPQIIAMLEAATVRALKRIEGAAP